MSNEDLREDLLREILRKKTYELNLDREFNSHYQALYQKLNPTCQKQLEVVVDRAMQYIMDGVVLSDQIKFMI